MINLYAKEGQMEARLAEVICFDGDGVPSFPHIGQQGHGLG